MRLAQLSLFALLVGLTGCSKPEKIPDTYPVAGKVLLPSGEPAHGAIVTFTPKAKDGKLTGAEGGVALKADGTFSLKSMGDKDGLPPGYYAVTVNPRALPAKEAATKALGMKSIPKKYWDEDSTDYFVTIDSAQTDLVIQLK